MLVQDLPLNISYAIVYADICFFFFNYLLLYITYQNRINATTSAFFVNIGLAKHVAYNFVYAIYIVSCKCFVVTADRSYTRPLRNSYYVIPQDNTAI